MGLSAGTRLGPYEVVAPLGAGGMGEVYRARDTRLGRDVAVKVVHPRLAADPDRLSRFEKEARAAAQLDHPNILVVHDVGTHEGSPFIVSELLQGESLREKLGTPLPPKRAVDYAIQIAHGLAAAHEKGIVHRDIKPENVFVTKDGHVKILDFGVAKLLPSFEPSGVDTETPTESVTQPGTALGTVSYMSPEQIRGQPIDARSDLFSLGVVIYEMLSGKRPFQRETAAETMTAILREEPPDLSETNRSVPAALENVVRHCLEKEPESRFQSARDVVFAIEALPEVSTARPTAPMSPAGVWLHRHRMPLAGAALLLAAVAGTLIFVSRRHSGSPSVLALPCKVLGSPESAYLTDAVPSTLSTLLAEVQGMDTKVPPTSSEVEKVNGDLDKIAAAYGVQSFVLSTATAEGDHLIFNIQLADARTRKVKWSHQYQGSRANYLAMAHEAAQGICKAVLPEAVPVVPTSSPTTNSESELSFQQGRYYTVRYLEHGDRADFDRALKALNHALELNPKDAATAAQIAYLYGNATLGRGQIPHAEGVTAMEAWVQKALALDPKCSMAWVARTCLEAIKPDADMGKQIEWSLKGAQLGMESSDAQQWLAIGLATGGSFELGVEALREALRLDPLSLDGYSFLALFLARSGRPEEALPVLDTFLSLDPGNHWASAFRVYALLKMRRSKEAATLFRRQSAGWPSRGFLGDRVQDITDVSIT